MRLDKELEQAMIAAGATVRHCGEAIPQICETNKEKRLLAAESYEHTTGRPYTWVVPVYVYCGDNARGTKGRIGRGGYERKAVHATMAKNHGDLSVAVELAHYERMPRNRCLTIRLTRLGPRLMDFMNCIASLKHIQDAVAERFGLDDGNPVFDWRYAQEKSDAYGVRIEVGTYEGQIK